MLVDFYVIVLCIFTFFYGMEGTVIPQTIVPVLKETSVQKCIYINQFITKL